MSRGEPKITKSSFDFASSERVSWIDEFANNIEKASKTAVEVARYRNELSIHEQINSIVSRQPTCATVEDLVQEYHKRTGLIDYLKVGSSFESKSDKVAFKDYGDIFSDYPEIRDKIINFAKNNIDTNHGQTCVPAVQCEILSQFRGDGLRPQDVENKVVAKFISDLIVDSQKQSSTLDTSSTNLGKGVGVDDDDGNGDNTNFHKALMPYMGQGAG